MEQFLKNQQHILYVSTVSKKASEKKIPDPYEGITKLMQVKHKVTYTCASDFFDRQNTKTQSVAISTGSSEGVRSCDNSVEDIMPVDDQIKQFSQSNVVDGQRKVFDFQNKEQEVASSMVLNRERVNYLWDLPEYTDESILSLVAEPYRFKICMMKEKAKNKNQRNSIL